MSLKPHLFPIVLLSILILECLVLAEEKRLSAVGDPGMRRDGLRVAIEAWNQCNEVGEEAPNMGSPRKADCFDVNTTNPIKLVHRVKEEENMLGISNASFGGSEEIEDVNHYAAWKEIYLGRKCEVEDKPKPWQFWMIMLKSGNMDTLAAICSRNGKKAPPFPPESGFPCFGPGCMNMPLMYHNYTSVLQHDGRSLVKGSFYGTWDLNSDVRIALTENDTSYHEVTWEKEVGKGSWKFHHILKTSSKYPWLMLYLIDIGSCWKNSGKRCNGDVTTDVTRYSEMIINPSIDSWCNPTSLWSCPPYHILSNGTRIHRSDKKNFPYKAYHIYCSPGNAEFPEEPFNFCDPYSNPQPQEILQILPHPVWGEYGYPTKKGEGWIGDPRTWELDVGRLSETLYFYQDPGTPPAERYWSSIDLGTEIYMAANHIAEWTVMDFDITVPEKAP